MRNLKRALSLALASIMLLGMMVTGAGAASNSFTDFDQIVNQEAAEVTSGLGIFDGYTDGSFGPEKVVTRAEMAVLVSQICINPEHIAWERDFYARLCDANFNDVPKWARTYVGVCASNGIMAGYGEGIFAPSDPATPQMACAVILRWLERDGWDYDTACDKAAELELIPAEALTGDTITRGDMAILIKRAQDYMAWLQTL